MAVGSVTGTVGRGLGLIVGRPGKSLVIFCKREPAVELSVPVRFVGAEGSDAFGGGVGKRDVMFSNGGKVVFRAGNVGLMLTFLGIIS